MNPKEKFLKFWRSDNEKIALLRDIFIALMAVLIVLILLWAYTGQWFAAPMVAIESGSMEHPDTPYGRYGTIDAGDMVLVQKVNDQSDIITYGAAKITNNSNNYFYGNWGDVIIYRKLGSREESQIIHRAMCWIDIEIVDGEKRYTIEEFGIYNQTSFGPIREIGLNKGNYAPNWSHSGFLTKGDNNNIFDQHNNAICGEPVKVEWISGKARLEIPWIGTINLLFEDLLHGKDTLKNVHQDSIVCLVLLIVILISIPIILDIYDYIKKKKKGKENNKKEENNNNLED